MQLGVFVKQQKLMKVDCARLIILILSHLVSYRKKKTEMCLPLILNHSFCDLHESDFLLNNSSNQAGSRQENSLTSN